MSNNIAYRAFGVKTTSYTSGETLSLFYDNRMRVTEWNIVGVMGWDYSYSNFGENTGRVTYARNRDDGTLDRSYDYDQVGRMWASHSGREARWHIGQESYSGADGPYSQNFIYDQWGNITQRNGWGVANASYTAGYSNNRRNDFSYDASGNLTNDGSQTYTYDATGQQATASGNSLSQAYDSDGLRGKKIENGATTSTCALQCSVNRLCRSSTPAAAGREAMSTLVESWWRYRAAVVARLVQCIRIR